MKLRIVKNLMLVLAFILGTNLTLHAFQLENTMEKGNEYYRNGKYEQALSEYSKILNEGFESAALYYNMGNAYYKLGKLGYAILYYERALKLAPDDEDINYNLKIANARKQDKIQEVPQIFLVVWWNSLLAMLTVKGWAFVTALFFVLSVLLIALYLFASTNSTRRFSFIFGSILLGLFLLNAFILFVKYDKETKTKFAVALQNTITVKQSPDENAVDAFVIHEGLKFKVLDKLGRWYKIKLPDGKVGWLHKKSVGII